MDEKPKSPEEINEDFKKDKEEFSNKLPEKQISKSVIDKSKEKPSFNYDDIKPLQNNYIAELYKSAKFSLDVDPLGEYDMTDKQKTFIKNYVEYGNVPLAAQLSEIDEQEAMVYFRKDSTQFEIRRIKSARYHRVFAGKMLTLDEVGGYLTALIMDEVPVSERVKPTEKIKVADMIIKINDMKSRAMNDPITIDAIDVEEQLKSLSLSSIQSLIDSSKNYSNKSTGNEYSVDKQKEEIIEQIQKANSAALTISEKDQLNSMSLDALLEILDSMTLKN